MRTKMNFFRTLESYIGRFSIEISHSKNKLLLWKMGKELIWGAQIKSSSQFE